MQITAWRTWQMSARARQSSHLRLTTRRMQRGMQGIVGRAWTSFRKFITLRTWTHWAAVGLPVTVTHACTSWGLARRNVTELYQCPNGHSPCTRTWILDKACLNTGRPSCQTQGMLRVSRNPIWPDVMYFVEDASECALGAATWPCIVHRYARYARLGVALAIATRSGQVWPEKSTGLEKRRWLKASGPPIPTYIASVRIPSQHVSVGLVQARPNYLVNLCTRIVFSLTSKLSLTTYRRKTMSSKERLYVAAGGNVSSTVVHLTSGASRPKLQYGKSYSCAAKLSWFWNVSQHPRVFFLKIRVDLRSSLDESSHSGESLKRKAFTYLHSVCYLCVIAPNFSSLSVNLMCW